MRSTYIRLHFAVFLLAFTAILGKWISLDPVPLVWYRTGIASIALGLGVIAVREIRFLQRDLLVLFKLGLLLAIHWVLFFLSIKKSNVSVALIAYGMTALFTSLMEPLIMRQKIKQRQWISAVLMVPAVILIAGRLEGNLLAGFGLGVCSALFMAWLSVEQKKELEGNEPIKITFLQMIGAFLILSIVQIPAGIPSPTTYDLILLAILGLVCTALAWKLVAKALKKLSAFDITLAYNLEPVYGIILGSILLQEHRELGTLFYIGTFLMVVLIILQPILSKHDQPGN